jgi:hypothetical protein
MPKKKKTAVSPAVIPAASPTPAAIPPPTAPPTAPATPPVTGVANGGNKGTKVALQTSYLALIAGLLAYYQPGDPFLLEAGVMTRDELIAAFQQFVASAEATKTSYLAWRADVQAERVEEQTVAPLRAGLKSTLEGRFGKSGTELTKFGFTPAKVGVKSTASKTAAVAKAKATRAARGTKGSVQKQAVTGNVTGVVITPMTAGPAVPVGTAAPATPAAPASPAATGGTPTKS